ncbi:MAG: hypothetical protein HRU04_05620 [Oceanospirillaceae bacterium]|nr:hypothetical protein [Oceanospirillaceae bacterium]
MMLTTNHPACPHLLTQIIYKIPTEDLADFIGSSGEAIEVPLAIPSFVTKIASYAGSEETLGSTLMLTTVNCAIPGLGHAIDQLKMHCVILSVTQELNKQVAGGRNEKII